MNLGANSLTGPIPSELGNLGSLKEQWLSVKLNLKLLIGLYLQRNSLTGPIPSQFGKLQRMNGLHLYENFLPGSVPLAIANLKWLYSDLEEYYGVSKQVSRWDGPWWMYWRSYFNVACKVEFTISDWKRVSAKSVLALLPSQVCTKYIRPEQCCNVTQTIMPRGKEVPTVLG